MVKRSRHEKCTFSEDLEHLLGGCPLKKGRAKEISLHLMQEETCQRCKDVIQDNELLTCVQQLAKDINLKTLKEEGREALFNKFKADMEGTGISDDEVWADVAEFEAELVTLNKRKRKT